jgi:hypothetical protein
MASGRRYATAAPPGERHAEPHGHHLRRRRTVALQADRFEHDAHAFGQALDVGDAALDIDAEQRPAERGCGQSRGAPGDKAEADGRRRQADRKRAGEASRREEHQGEAAAASADRSASGLARQPW